MSGQTRKPSLLDRIIRFKELGITVAVSLSSPAQRGVRKTESFPDASSFLTSS